MAGVGSAVLAAKYLAPKNGKQFEFRPFRFRLSSCPPLHQRRFLSHRKAMHREGRHVIDKGVHAKQIGWDRPIDADTVSHAVASELQKGNNSIHIATGAHGMSRHGFVSEHVSALKEKKFYEEDIAMARRKMQENDGARIHVHDMAKTADREAVEQARANPQKVVMQGECYGKYRNDRKNQELDGGENCVVS